MSSNVSAQVVKPEAESGTPKRECIDCDVSSMELNCWFCGEPMLLPAQASEIRRTRKVEST